MRTARIRTTCRSKRQRVRQRPSIAAGRWPGRSGAAGSAVSRGAKLRAAGIARRAFPWRQAKHAAPQARRREGLKPHGRDDEGGTGRSPKARLRIEPTRHMADHDKAVLLKTRHLTATLTCWLRLLSATTQARRSHQCRHPPHKCCEPHEAACAGLSVRQSAAQLTACGRPEGC